MDPSEPENSKDKSPADKIIKRTNPAKLMAMGFMKKELLAKEVIALSQDPKMAKVPLRNPVTSTATKPYKGESVGPNVIYVPSGTPTGIFRNRAKVSLSAIIEDEKEEPNAVDKNSDDVNKTI